MSGQESRAVVVANLPDENGVGVPRQKSLELGMALIVVVLPLFFFPFSVGPFSDPKLVVVLFGAALIWTARPRLERRLVIGAALWVCAMGLSAMFGVDPWWSLMGPDNSATGLVLMGTCAFLLVAGSSVPDRLAARLPSWLVGTGVVVSIVALTARFVPELFETLVPNLSFRGSTVGAVGVLSGLMAACIAAMTGLSRLRTQWLVVVAVILASGLSVAAERSGYVAVAMGLVIAIWRSRVRGRRALLLAGTVAAVLVAWFLAGPLLPRSVGDVSAVGRFGEIDTGSAEARLHVLGAVTEEWIERPGLGWGPGNTWSAYLSSASNDLVKSAGRGWGDAHNIVAEALVTTGLVGIAAFLWLVWTAASRIVRSPPHLGWAFGVSAALAVNHLVQPLTVTGTALLFLFLGVAAGGGPAIATGVDQESSTRTSNISMHALRDQAAWIPRSMRLSRVAVGVLLGVGLLLSLLAFASSVFERYGRTYNSESALRAALALSPGRVSAAQALATSLAVDGRSGDSAAAAESRRLAERLVELHPWNPAVRLIASDVHRLLLDEPGARSWIRRHLARFPGDDV
jgi:O-antigen ligase